LDTRQEIRQFLTSRRARVTPEQAGLRTYGNGPRRFPGLRREEVALLAGVSIAYYTKLERGDTSGVSETVLEALARALRLDEAAVLRGEAGRNPYDRDLSDLVGELSTRSEEFRTRWARHDVRYHDTGKKRFHHPVVGDLEVAFEVMTFVADPHLTMFAFTAEPGSKSEEALRLLASWTATLHETDSPTLTDR